MGLVVGERHPRCIAAVPLEAKEDDASDGRVYGNDGEKISITPITNDQ